MEEIRTKNRLLQAKPIRLLKRIDSHVLGLSQLSAINGTERTTSHATRTRATQLAKHVLWCRGAGHWPDHVET